MDARIEETLPARNAPSPGGEGRAVAPRRKLHRGHFAFMRAIVQGIPHKASWDRYLRIEGEAGDARAVRTTIAWIRQEFAAAARREARPGTARLVALDVRTLGAPGPALPSLEEFAAERGLGDFSQTDQLAAYEEAFGAATLRAKRRERLINRQLEALAWLEEQVAEPPRAGDAIGAWFSAPITGHLQASGVTTIAELLARINGIGRLWYGSVKAIGATKAARIEEWLRAYEESIGIGIGRHVVLARSRLYAHELNAVVAPATDIRPLEKLIVPAHLDGRDGKYRRPQAQCLMHAANDYEAILAWLRSKHGMTPDQKADKAKRRRGRSGGVPLTHDWMAYLSHTQRAYRKEAERFLLWAVVQGGKPLSSMTTEDCIAYREFLADPQPAARWCGERARERWSPLWRPFEGPLKPTAQHQAITILRNLYGFLVSQNYLMGNPWSGVNVPRSSAPRLNAGRSFTEAQWEFINRELEDLDETPANTRLAFALRFLYATGVRLSEAVSVTLDDLQWVSYPVEGDDDEPVEGYLLRVVGKGGKVREVPVPDPVIDELKTYLASRGLDPVIESPRNAGQPVIAKVPEKQEAAVGLPLMGTTPTGYGIAATTLYDQLKTFFAKCSARMADSGDQRAADRFAAASTHWLRHTHASHAIARGMPIEVAQQNLGHASLATTTVYVTTEGRRRMKAVGQFWRNFG